MNRPRYQRGSALESCATSSSHVFICEEEAGIAGACCSNPLEVDVVRVAPCIIQQLILWELLGKKWPAGNACAETGHHLVPEAYQNVLSFVEAITVAPNGQEWTRYLEESLCGLSSTHRRQISQIIETKEKFECFSSKDVPSH